MHRASRNSNHGQCIGFMIAVVSESSGWELMFRGARWGQGANAGSQLCAHSPPSRQKRACGGGQHGSEPPLAASHGTGASPISCPPDPRAASSSWSSSSSPSCSGPWRQRPGLPRRRRRTCCHAGRTRRHRLCNLRSWRGRRCSWRGCGRAGRGGAGQGMSCTARCAAQQQQEAAPRHQVQVSERSASLAHHCAQAPPLTGYHAAPLGSAAHVAHFILFLHTAQLPRFVPPLVQPCGFFSSSRAVAPATGRGVGDFGAPQGLAGLNSRVFGATQWARPCTVMATHAQGGRGAAGGRRARHAPPPARAGTRPGRCNLPPTPSHSLTASSSTTRAAAKVRRAMALCPQGGCSGLAHGAARWCGKM